MWKEKDIWNFSASQRARYENVSTMLGAYEFAARRLLEMTGSLQDKTVVDLGTGTGNSAVEILRSSSPKMICGVDLSRWWLNWASYKFGKADQEGTKIERSVTKPTFKRILEQRQECSQNEAGKELVVADGAILPLADCSCDVLFCCQSLHWIALAAENEDISFLELLKSFRHSLKPGGVLVFDQSGHQVDFGEETNSIHFLSSCSYQGKLVAKLNEIMVANGYPHQIEFQQLEEGNRAYRMFTPKSLVESLEQARFIYRTELFTLPYSLDQVEAAMMFRKERFFKNTGFAQRQQIDIMKQAFKAVRVERQDFVPPNETFLGIKAIKYGK